MGDREPFTMDDYPGSQAVAFSGQSAGGDARQHNGNNYNNHTYHYTLAKRRSDDFLREDRRNVELLRAAAEGQYLRVQHLLHIGADFDYRDEKDLTALHHAVLSGFEDVVELLLRRGADVNASSVTAGSPLCLAVLKDRSHIVRLLVSKFRAAVNLADPELGTPSHCAAFTGNSEVARFLLENGADVDSTCRVDSSKLLAYQKPISIDTLGDQSLVLCKICWTEAAPLTIAISANKLALVHLLLKAGCQADKPSSYGSEPCLRRPLRMAAWCGLTEIVALLISFGAELDLGSEGSGVALLVASHAGHADCVKQLIEAGASVDIRDKIGNTALIAASTNGQGNCVGQLLSTRASPDLVDEDGCTAIILASIHGSESCVEQLLKAGASLQSQEKAYGTTALHEAVLHGHSKCAQILCEHGADVNFRRLDGATALHCAASQGQLEDVRTLLKYQADPSLAHEEGWTPLMFAIDAAESQSVAIVEVLLQAGAVVTAQSDNGKTALHVAASTGQTQIAKLLLEANAALDVACKDGRWPLHFAAPGSEMYNLLFFKRLGQLAKGVASASVTDFTDRSKPAHEGSAADGAIFE